MRSYLFLASEQSSYVKLVRNMSWVKIDIAVIVQEDYSFMLILYDFLYCGAISFLFKSKFI
jgi:hypothetical protein